MQDLKARTWLNCAELPGDLEQFMSEKRACKEKIRNECSGKKPNP